MQITRYNNQHLIDVAHDGVYLQNYTVSQSIKPHPEHLPPSSVGNPDKHMYEVWGEEKVRNRILVEIEAKRALGKPRRKCKKISK
jgi:hypothetical protein